MLALVLHVLLQLVIALREGPGDHRDREQHARVHEDGQDLERGVLGGGAHLQHGHDRPAEDREHVEQAADSRDDEAAPPGQHEAGGDHQKYVERDEDRLGTAGRGDDAGDEDRVQSELEPRDPLQRHAPPLAERQHEAGGGAPEHRHHERPEGVRERLRESEQRSDRQHDDGRE
jgi:hypothetical protein